MSRPRNSCQSATTRAPSSRGPGIPSRTSVSSLLNMALPQLALSIAGLRPLGGDLYATSRLTSMIKPRGTPSTPEGPSLRSAPHRGRLSRGRAWIREAFAVNPVPWSARSLMRRCSLLAWVANSCSASLKRILHLVYLLVGGAPRGRRSPHPTTPPPDPHRRRISSRLSIGRHLRLLRFTC